MKTKLKTSLAAVAALSSMHALAGGGMTGGATEITQILNNVQLVESYGQQLTAYQTQLQQYAASLQNLANNPAGVILPNLTQMANNAARLLAAGQDISSSMSRVDQNFADTFQSPQAATFATKYSLWTNASEDGLKAAMENAGLQREQFPDDATALQALTTNLANSKGNLDALHALGSINAQQVQESMKLRDLISQQQVAENTFLTAQAAKDQAKQDANTINFGNFSIPPLSSFSNPTF